jgi:hypothetical protein
MSGKASACKRRTADQYAVAITQNNLNFDIAALDDIRGCMLRGARDHLAERDALGMLIARSEATKQSRFHRTGVDCFAPLAMTQ